MNKIWAVLASMRDSPGGSRSSTASSTGSNSSSISNLAFPDPLPPPASTKVHNTRTMRSSGASSIASQVYVAQSAQMVPVVVALIDAAIETDVVKAELDNGTKEGREKVREAKEKMKEENVRWEQVAKEALKVKEKEKEKGKDKSNDGDKEVSIYLNASYHAF